jgi:hypothetical protein
MPQADNSGIIGRRQAKCLRQQSVRFRVKVLRCAGEEESDNGLILISDQ